MGEPVSPARQPTPRNLSAPAVANTRHTSSCPSDRMLAQKAPDGRIRGQLVDDLPGRNPTMGGSRDTLANDWQVRPTGSLPAIPVMMAIPLQKWPRTARKWAVSKLGAPLSPRSSTGAATMSERSADSGLADSGASGAGGPGIAMTLPPDCWHR